MVWIDEAGFSRLPLAVRTWAPRRQTPILRVKLTHDHLAAISGITLDGRRFMQTQAPAYTAEAVVGFLRVMLRKLRGKILVVWDPTFRTSQCALFGIILNPTSPGHFYLGGHSNRSALDCERLLHAGSIFRWAA
jgi:DDE superfamily endonuclease